MRYVLGAPAGRRCAEVVQLLREHGVLRRGFIVLLKHEEFSLDLSHIRQDFFLFMSADHLLIRCQGTEYNLDLIIMGTHMLVAPHIRS